MGKDLLSGFSPKFSIGADPNCEVSFSLEVKPKSSDFEQILQLPERIAEKKDIKIIVCIDEFQQVAEFADSKSFQKRLRGVWQLQHRVSYCLFGSKKHIMNELFEKRSVLQEYNLNSSANISALKKSMEKKELIDFDRRRVFIADPVLKLWFKRELSK